MKEHDVIVIGGSAGSLEPLATIVSGLPVRFPAAILVVMHTSPDNKSVLPEILSRSTSLTVRHAVGGEPLLRGRVYIAPPNHHLLVQAGIVEVIQGPHENGFRPAIDPLFRSAAQIYGARTAGILLSGALDDGTFGLHAIKQAGGLAIVQHPYEATVPSMPLTAIQNVEVDYISHAREIAPMLVTATAQNRGDQPISGIEADEVDARDTRLEGTPPDQLLATQGPPTIYSCPECGGTLWELQEGGHLRFRCHTGHGFTANSLLSQQDDKLEHALWTGIRVLQEQSALHRRLADSCRQRGMEATARKYLDRSADELQKAKLLRSFVSSEEATSPPILTVNGL